MTNPLRPINDARVEIDRRQKRRHAGQADLPGADVAVVADELTLMRAEMTVIRGLLAARADNGISPWAFWTVVLLLLVTFLILLAKSGGLLA